MLRSISPIALLDLLRQRPALWRQFKSPREALEQAKPKLFLQSADAVTDCALREIQLARGLGEAEMPRGHTRRSAAHQAMVFGACADCGEVGAEFGAGIDPIDA